MAFDGRTLRFSKIDDLLVIVHAPMDPDPGEWKTMIEACRARADSFRRCLVLASSVKLTPSQRGQLAHLVNRQDVKVAVLVDSAVSRGMVTALGWVTGKYRAFAEDGIESAVAYLGGDLNAVRVRDEIRSMQTELGRAKSATA